MRRFTAFAILGLLLCIGTSQAQRTRAPQPARTDVAGCGFLGIYPNDIGRKTAEKFGLGERRGAIVIGVVDNTGAARAGVQEKDVITALNGEFITSESQLRQLIVKQTPGSFVRLDLFRDGQTRTINAEITSRAKYYRGATGCGDAPTLEAPQQQPQQQQQQRIEKRMRGAEKDLDISDLDVRELDADMLAAERELADAQKELRVTLLDFRESRNMANGYEGNTGLGLQKISPQLAEYFRTGSTSGALVNEVAEGSPAARSGIQAGDVIVGVNGQAVAGPMDAVKGIVDDNDGSVDVRLVREGTERTIQITSQRGTTPVAPNLLPDIGAHSAPQRELLRLAGQNLQ